MKHGWQVGDTVEFISRGEPSNLFGIIQKVDVKAGAIEVLWMYSTGDIKFHWHTPDQLWWVQASSIPTIDYTEETIEFLIYDTLRSDKDG